MSHISPQHEFASKKISGVEAQKKEKFKLSFKDGSVSVLEMEEYDKMQYFVKSKKVHGKMMYSVYEGNSKTGEKKMLWFDNDKQKVLEKVPLSHDQVCEVQDEGEGAQMFTTWRFTLLRFCSFGVKIEPVKEE